MTKIESLGIATTIMVSGIALMWTTASFAAGPTSGPSAAVQSHPEAQYQTVAGRSHTTLANGMCGRNTGMPTAQLNLRDRCDVLEFWTRQNRSF